MGLLLGFLLPLQAQLPASPQGPVEIDHRHEFLEAGLGEIEPGGEEILLGLEDLEVVREALSVAGQREFYGDLELLAPDALGTALFGES